MNNEQIAENIERDVKERWGWVINVCIDGENVSWDANREINKDRYDLYPGMTQETADSAVMDEILLIIRKYLPDFRYTSYEQSGKLHVFEQEG